jgi:hypothetical protein
MQSSGPHPTLTLVLSIWAGVGPLVGLMVGHYLIRSWQTRQWILDARKIEFRELLSALSTMSKELLAFTATRQFYRGTEWDRLIEAQKSAFAIIMDRIYIAEDIKNLGWGEKFAAIGVGDDQIGVAFPQMQALILEVAETARKG